MNIGEFKKNSNGYLLGLIVICLIDFLWFGLCEVESINECVLVYEIFVFNVGNCWVQVGVFWEVVVKNLIGECFFQGMIDDLSFVDLLLIVLFGIEEEGFCVVWCCQ